MAEYSKRSKGREAREAETSPLLLVILFNTHPWTEPSFFLLFRHVVFDSLSLFLFLLFSMAQIPFIALSLQDDGAFTKRAAPRRRPLSFTHCCNRWRLSCCSWILGGEFSTTLIHTNDCAFLFVVMLLLWLAILHHADFLSPFVDVFLLPSLHHDAATVTFLIALFLCLQLISLCCIYHVICFVAFHFLCHLCGAESDTEVERMMMHHENDSSLLSNQNSLLSVLMQTK